MACQSRKMGSRWVLVVPLPQPVRKAFCFYDKWNLLLVKKPKTLSSMVTWPTALFRRSRTLGLVCLKLLMLIGHSSRLHQLQSANVHDINSESSEDHCWFLLSVFSSLLFSFLKSGVLFGPKCRKPEYFIKCTVDSFCHTFMHCAPERPQVQWRENYLQNAPAQRGPLENTGENPVVGGGGAHLYHPDIYFFISTNTQINDKCEFLTSLCPSCGSSGRHQKPRPTLRTAALKSKEI